MKSVQKQKAESFVKTLYQASEEIKRLMELSDADSKKIVLVILGDCQQGAIELGNMIESSESAGCPTIRLLEEYCEALYQIHCHIAETEKPEPVYAGKAYKSLRKMLIQIENSIHNDIRVRREAVFLPYKASMWDSLESVWMAAREDEDCDAYVIPIPYYDKNPDGSFREMHYEGELYPEYVPVTSYKEYDFAVHRPDMIFIHNPYDEFNYVTSVHPFFYSKNLKQFTDKLIYIPYFILEEISPDNQKAVDSIAHFCLSSGVQSADKVIVQSEDMRQIYINVLMRETGCGEAGRKMLEEKILGLGSPKIDKVLSAKREDYI